MTRSARTRPLDVSLADVVTAANALCGFFAIAVAARVWTGAPEGRLRLTDGEVILASGLIIAGALLDSVDGAVARRYGGSALGEHLEVMSDVVTFGLAPSIVFAVDAAAYGRPWSGLALVVAAAYALAALLRLARYASTPEAAKGRGLTGLPSPPSAMAAVALVVLHLPAPVALAAFATLAVLMIATFPFPRIGAATAPFMAVWWLLAGLVAVRVVPAWAVAVFTLVAMSAILLVVPLGTRRGGRGRARGVGVAPFAAPNHLADDAQPASRKAWRGRMFTFSKQR